MYQEQRQNNCPMERRLLLETRETPRDEDLTMNAASRTGQSPPHHHAMNSHVPEHSQGLTQRQPEPSVVLQDGLCRGMSLQQVTLDKAVAPLLPRPTAPFDRTERKRAHTSAVYYSECFLRGIEPLDADTAAVEVQGQYDKWWIQRTAYKEETKISASKIHESKAAQKRHRKESEEDGKEECNDGVNRRNVASYQFGLSQEDQDAEIDCNQNSSPPMEQISMLSVSSKTSIEIVKNQLIEDLRQSGGVVDTLGAIRCIEILQMHYGEGGLRKVDPSSLIGNWLTISKPTYTECKGKSKNGENLYSLGRIGFDMFKPTGLLCSVQASFNNVQPIDPKNPGRPLHVPKKLMRDIRKGECRLHSYDIVVAITVEPGQDRKGHLQDDSSGGGNEYIVPRQIRGILTTQGYSIPDPIKPERLSIWFSGGTLEVQDEDDLEEWKQIFDVTSAPDRVPKEYASILAAKVLLGAHLPENLEEDGTMSFSLNRPIGGHGSVYCDVIFMDDQLRIMKGHHGSVYVCIRVPEVPA
ncbi:hypothetical protein IV203_003178 [Nitzschia inconspicua]|uniref:Uncharacterized protein n=1 Tax=Nitzschia inconspicua TaxID=303405 RepID=A0A9K3L2T9_9STRA|nr:hypothetical protein IV203_003178 [Nitzschia inconspicua]